MKLSVPLEVTEELEVAGGTFSATFQQPRQREYIKREELWERARESQTLLWGYVQAWAVYLTLRECELETEEGPLWNAMQLKQGLLPLSEFLKGWEKLPPEICLALWEAAVKVVPDWDHREQTTAEGTFPERDGAAELQEESSPF